MSASITVTHAGLLCTVQDLGRHGLMAQGFSPSGAMDAWSLRAANLLVGNQHDAPALEFCLVGPSFTVNATDPGDSLAIAFTGAACQPTINGKPAPMGMPLIVHQGDVVTSGNTLEGSYGYIAFRGGVSVPARFGSFSTSLKYHVGGMDGRALQANDVINCGNFTQHPLEQRVLPPWLRISRMLNTTNREPLALAVVPGAQERLFTEEGIKTFYSAPYTITPASDRMGLRLEGEPVEAKAGNDIISDGISLGAVQIPATGMPIIMMRDRQTTGGYAKMGAVASACISKLAQCPAGRTVRFVRTSVDDAQHELRRMEEAFQAWAQTKASPAQILEHVHWQKSLRGLDALAYYGNDHQAAVVAYALYSNNQESR